METPVGQLMNIVVDCPDADISARFWAAVLGWERVQEDVGWVDIADASDGRRRLVFQQIDAPMFVKVSSGSGFLPSGPVICCIAGCGQDRDEPLRVWRESSYEVTLSKSCGAPGTAGGSFAGQRLRQPISGPDRPRECALAGGDAEVGIDLAGDVALQAADDFLLGFPLGCAAFGVGAGSRV